MNTDPIEHHYKMSKEASAALMLHKMRRERIATACLQGILACFRGHPREVNSAPERAEIAIKHADALIQMLDVEEEDGQGGVK